MRGARSVRAALLAAMLAGGALAQDDEPLDSDLQQLKDVVDQSVAACAADAASRDCGLLRVQRAALVAQAVAELGNLRDRADIETIRPLLSAPDLEVRASAAFALAKMQPDTADTAALRRLALEPYETVRAGAWSAAKASGDPAANLIAARTGGKRVIGYGVRQSPPPFDPDALETMLPNGSAYVWFDAPLRKSGQLVFVAPGSVEEVTAHFAALGGRTGEPLEAVQAWSEDIRAQTVRYGDATLFQDVRVVALADGTGVGAGKPVRLAVVYRDAGFDSAGFALIWVPGGNLTPPPLQGPVVTGKKGGTSDGFLKRLSEIADVKEGADPDDAALWFACMPAGGFGAELYLEAYPEGVYKAEAQALLAAPQIRLDALAYAEGSKVQIAFRNMPGDLDGEVHLIAEGGGGDFNLGYLHVRGGAPHVVTLDPYLTPGVYRVLVYADASDGGGHFELNSDLRIAADSATLSLAQARFPPNVQIEVSFDAMRGMERDYVAVAKAGAQAGDYLSYVFTKGAKSGTALLKAPGQAGDYEIRAFFNNDRVLMRAAVAFTVAADAPTPAPPAALPGAPVITLTKTVFAVNEPVVFHVSGLPGKKQDWVSIAAAGMADGQWSVYDYTKGETEGDFTLKGQAAGQYEVRVYFQSSGDVQARAPFTVK